MYGTWIEVKQNLVQNNMRFLSLKDCLVLYILENHLEMMMRIKTYTNIGIKVNPFTGFGIQETKLKKKKQYKYNMLMFSLATYIIQYIWNIQYLIGTVPFLNNPFMIINWLLQILISHAYGVYGMNTVHSTPMIGSMRANATNYAILHTSLLAMTGGVISVYWLGKQDLKPLFVYRKSIESEHLQYLIQGISFWVVMSYCR